MRHALFPFRRDLLDSGGFSPVPVQHRSKRPVLNGWEKLEITVDVASQYFDSAAQNIEGCCWMTSSEVPTSPAIVNAAASAQVAVRDIVAPVDTVMFCLSKALGAPVGSMLTGPKNTIAQGRLYRKRLDGGMRQAGVLAQRAWSRSRRRRKNWPKITATRASWPRGWRRSAAFRSIPRLCNRTS